MKNISSPFCLLLLPIILLALTGCQNNSKKFIFEGKIDGITQAEFYLLCEGQFNGFDTLQIENGKFHYEREIDEPMVLTLLYPNYTHTYVIAEPGKDIYMKAAAGKLGEADINGSEENELLSKFRQETHDKRENEQQMAAANFVRSYAGKLAAVAVFHKYFVATKNCDAETALPLLEELKRQQPAQSWVTSFYQRLRSLLTYGNGGRITDFHAISTDSSEISAKQFRGKPLIIGFFSTYLNSNYQIIPRLAELEKTYGDSLGILAISLDYDLKRCKTRIEQDSLKAPVVCDQKAFYSPLVLQFGVKNLPDNILADSLGNILQRNIPLDRLNEEVKKLMKEKGA